MLMNVPIPNGAKPLVRSLFAELWIEFVFKNRDRKGFLTSGQSPHSVKEQLMENLLVATRTSRVTTFLDLGANVGLVAQRINKGINGDERGGGKALEIWAFEPDPLALSRLGQHSADFSVVRAAVSGFGWHSRTTARLFRRSDFSGVDSTTSSSILRSKTGIDKSNHLSVPLVTIKSILHSVPPGQVVLKVDVEGAEYGILMGMLLSGRMRQVELVFVEFHPRKIRAGWLRHIAVWALYRIMGQHKKVRAWY